MYKQSVDPKFSVVDISASNSTAYMKWVFSTGKLIKIEKERSVDVVITRLRKKIEDSPKNPKYLQTIRGKGYVLWIE